MNFTFNITKNTYNTKKQETNVDQEILSNLVKGGIEINALDGNEVHRKANEIMEATNLDDITCSMEKDDYFFMIIANKDCEDLHVIVDKRGVKFPNAISIKKDELDIEELVSSYC